MSNFKQILIPALAIVTFSAGCDRTRSFDFTGKAQKGPLLVGANVTVNELNSSFEQTGGSFTSSIASDDGSFGLNSVELETDYALVTVNGAYFDELSGQISANPINLQALADLSGRSTVNVNTLTHVIRSRMEALVSDMSFEQASRQAQDELIAVFFGESEQLGADFDQLDISNVGDDNGALLAFSLLMMRDTVSSTATLVELLTRLRTDFGENGELNNSELLDQIRENAALLNEEIIRNNLEARYLQIGQTAVIPDFEKYLGKFQLQNAETILTEPVYPPVIQPETWSSTVNLLDKSLVELSRSAFYSEHNSNGPCIAAFTPVGQKLTVKLKGEGISYKLLLPMAYPPVPGPHNGGFVFESNTMDELTFSSQRQNVLMTYVFDNVGVNYDIEVEYYENGSLVPTFVKTISVIP